MRRYGSWAMGLAALVAASGGAVAAAPGPAPIDVAAAARPPAATPPLLPSAEALALTVDASARLTLPISIDERGPYRFIVDTGAERTVISTALAGALGLVAGEELRIVTVGGHEAVRTAMIPRLSLSAARSVRDVQAPMLAASAIGADGMLGIDALHGQHVVFDFRKRTMTIATPAQIVNDPNDIVVTARTRRGRLVLGEARVNQQRVEAVLDTGSEVTIGNAALRLALEKRRHLPEIRRGEIVTITGQTVAVDVISVRALEVGGITFQNMPIAFLASEAFTQLGLADRPAVLLGMDALSLFDRVSVDFRSRRVRFRPGIEPAAMARSEDAPAAS